ncbi:MAG: MFS transporter, partial [Rikenellaceae bacterium]
ISASDSIWIINAYQIAIITTLLPFSALGDHIGYKRIYLCGLALFIVMSIGCAAAWDLRSLVIFRVLQGLGASAVMSVNTSLVRLIFPKRMLGRGIGINSMVVSVSSVMGPTVAATILAVGEWQWLFVINMPLGMVAIIIGILYLPDNISLRGVATFRWRDALLNALAFGFLFALISSASHKLPIGWLIFEVIGAVTFVYVYVKSQLRRENPILPFDLLRIPIFSMSIFTSVMIFIAQMSVMVSMPFILHYQYHYSAIEIGWVLTALPAVNIVSTSIAGFLVDRYHAGILGCIGLSILVVAMYLLALVPEGAEPIEFIWRLGLTGLGFGFFQAPNNSMIISSAPLARSGSASGMMASARLTGQITGAASVALIFLIVPMERGSQILFLSAFCTTIAAILSFIRLSLPLPEALRR